MVLSRKEKKAINAIPNPVTRRIVIPTGNPKKLYKNTRPIAPDLYIGFINSNNSEKMAEPTNIPTTKTAPSIRPPAMAVTDVAGQYPPMTIPTPRINPART